MCGIAGSVNFSLDASTVKKMLLHRGPDEQTEWRSEALHFIHTRLAIQELSEAGRQPMHLGDLHIIFNGEIYNHFELRALNNLSCHSHSDTETLLHLFRKKGIAMLSELDGMFAIAIYDHSKCKLWLVRDRAGEKPLYYQQTSTTLVFASELNALRGLVNPVVDHQRVANFLAVGYLPGHETPYTNINELPPAHYLEVDVEALSTTLCSWWNILPAFKRKQTLSFEEALRETDDVLNLSVKRRLLSSDLEVGTFLSGGIDSGIVTAMAARHSGRLKTFTVSFTGSYDEAPLAAAVAKHLGTQHHEIVISFDRLEEDIEKIFDNYGEPIMDDSIIPSYYVAKEAKKQLTVILNGDAGDELFGGYRRYVPFAKLNLFSQRLQGVYRPILKALPKPADKMNYYNYFHRLLTLLGSRNPDVYFAATNDLLHARLNLFTIQPDLSGYQNSIESLLKEPLTDLQRLMCLDFTNILPSVLLVKMDIATMAHSLEGRSPFLAKEVMEFVPGLPDNFKIRNSQTKYLLRMLAKKYLPAEIIHQPKRGFEIPLRQWTDTRLKNIIFDYLNPEASYIRTLIKPQYVDAMLLNKGNVSPEQRARILFSWLSVERWKKQLES